MDRTACVDLPAFPLQWLLRARPQWRAGPVAVVEADSPRAAVLWVDERAWNEGVRPGLTYGAALALCGALRAAPVPEGEIEREVSRLARRLRTFTPHVEPSREEPGVFWLDATGLERLFGSLRNWARLIHAELEQRGYRASVVAGFSRFGSYALARARRGVLVLDSPAEERRAARLVPLPRLRLDPRALETLEKLGVRTVGEFADLPHEGIERRFGAEAARLHRLAAGLLELPLAPERPQPPALQRAAFEPPAAEIPRLLAAVERLLPPLLEVLRQRGRALARLQVGLRFERLGDHLERLCPAAPTLDARSLRELVRLRFEAQRRLPDRVVELVLVGDGVRASAEQWRLFEGRPRRDLRAAAEALARVRAELGEQAVVRARVREAHLPEARLAWEPLRELPAPRPRETAQGRLVRRIYVPPLRLPAPARHEPDGWMLRGLEAGPMTRVLGPYILSGGWWQRAVHREYHFAETQKGELLWIYYDRLRRQWFLQGRVE